MTTTRTFLNTARALCLAPVLLAAPAQAGSVVDVELQLLMDVSGSVSEAEFQLQHQGYVDAFRSKAVQDAILDTTNGDLGKIAVQFIYWSSSSRQDIAVDWTLLDSASSIDAFAGAIDATDRPFGGATAPGSALDFAVPLFETNGFDAAQQVIDISGDGRQNSGTSTSASRDAALAAGIDRINGIYVEGEAGLSLFYEDNIRAGENSFTIAASGFDTFGESLQLKLAAEIQGLTPDQLTPIPLPASAVLLISAMTGLLRFKSCRKCRIKAKRRQRKSLAPHLGAPCQGDLSYKAA